MTPEVERFSLDLSRTIRKMGTVSLDCKKLVCIPEGCHLLLLKVTINSLKLRLDVGRGK